jgi:hypothetical protein
MTETDVARKRPPQVPLTCMSVLDFGLLLLSPFSTRTLADMGADVLKIESAQGDPILAFRGFSEQLEWNGNRGENDRRCTTGLLPQAISKLGKLREIAPVVAYLAGPVSRYDTSHRTGSTADLLAPRGDPCSSTRAQSAALPNLILEQVI